MPSNDTPRESVVRTVNDAQDCADRSRDLRGDADPVTASGSVDGLFDDLSEVDLEPADPDADDEPESEDVESLLEDLSAVEFDDGTSPFGSGGTESTAALQWSP